MSNQCCEKCANGAGKYALAIAKPYCLNSACECHTTPPSTRHEKIEAGAKDFANRFEGVMKELANDAPPLLNTNKQ